MDELDKCRINQALDEDGRPMHDCASDAIRYKIGIDGAHLMLPFQCDLCLFRTLFKRNPRGVTADKENLIILRRINLDVIWAREPSTISKNVGYLNKLITTCEASGFSPQLPALGPFPLDDSIGLAVAFSMIIQSTCPGRHSKKYTQFATIRKQRSAYSNLYNASQEAIETGQVLSSGYQTSARITHCPTNSIWFGKWISGCETRMGFVLKQNKAISIDIIVGLVNLFKHDIILATEKSWHRQRLCYGLAFSVLSFAASLRGSEGLKVDLQVLMNNIHRGRTIKARDKQLQGVKSRLKDIPHVILPLRGRFKGEKGELCHLIPLANVSQSGLPIRPALELLIATRKEMNVNDNQWAFVDPHGNKLMFQEMNDIILEQLEKLKEEDEQKDCYDLKGVDISEQYSINRSFRRGSATHAQNQKVPEHVINVQNRWRKVEGAKGRRPKFGMIENYSDIEHLIPTAIRYSEML